jgi:hypothetical protein
MRQGRDFVLVMGSAATFTLENLEIMHSICDMFVGWVFDGRARLRAEFAIMFQSSRGEANITSLPALSGRSKDKNTHRVVYKVK